MTFRQFLRSAPGALLRLGVLIAAQSIAEAIG